MCAKSAPNFPDVCMVEEGGGGGTNLPPSYKRDFAELYHRQITFKLSIFTNCGGRGGCVLDGLWIFASQKLKKPWKSLFDHNLLVFSAKELTGSNVKNVYPYDFVTEELLHGWTGRFL